MTTVHLNTITASIAELNIPGVTVYDTDSIPENALGSTPCLTPRPDNFVSEVVFTPVAFGSGERSANLEYTLTYNLLFAPVGSGLGLFSVYHAMLESIADILEVAADNHVPDGAVDVSVRNLPNIAIIKDAAGNDFHGIEIQLRVLEYLEVD